MEDWFNDELDDKPVAKWFNKKPNSTKQCNAIQNSKWKSNPLHASKKFHENIGHFPRKIIYLHSKKMIILLKNKEHTKNTYRHWVEKETNKQQNQSNDDKLNEEPFERVTQKSNHFQRTHEQTKRIRRSTERESLLHLSKTATIHFSCDL